MKNEMKYITVRAPLAQSKEPFFGAFIANGTETFETLVEKLAERGIAANAQEARLVLRIAAGVIRQAVAEESLRVNLGVVTFEPAISGSVAAMDAPLTSANRIYVRLRAGSNILGALAGVTPALDATGGAAVEAPRIDKIEDVATFAPAIVGTGAFVVTGRNIFAEDEEEKIELVSRDGKTVVAAQIVPDVMGGASGERVYARLAEAVAPGTWTLRLSTRAFGDVLQSVSKSVKVVAP